MSWNGIVEVAPFDDPCHERWGRNTESVWGKLSYFRKKSIWVILISPVSFTIQAVMWLTGLLIQLWAQKMAVAHKKILFLVNVNHIKSILLLKHLAQSFSSIVYCLGSQPPTFHVISQDMPPHILDYYVSFVIVMSKIIILTRISLLCTSITWKILKVYEMTELSNKRLVDHAANYSASMKL